MFDSGGGDEVVFFDADASTEGFVVETGFGGEDVAFFEGVVPGGVEVRGFVGVETDAVAKVMEEGTGQVGVKKGFGVVK